MMAQVEEKLKELKLLRNKEYYKQKDADLENWGLAAKKKGKNSTPTVITDEDYARLIKASNGVGKTGRNTVAVAMSRCSVAITVICIVIAVVALITSESKGFAWCSLWLVTGFVLRVLFRGIGEAIRLLQQIIDGDCEKPDAPEQTAQAPAPQYIPVQPPIYQPAYAQPYYAQAPVQVPVQAPMQPPVQAPVQAPAPAKAPETAPAVNDYQNMPSYSFDSQDDFFTKPYDTKAPFGE